VKPGSGRVLTTPDNSSARSLKLAGHPQSFEVTMLLWASILAGFVSGFGIVNYGAVPWIGDLIAVVFLISMFVAVCATELRT
jgi:hypothetical protein